MRVMVMVRSTKSSEAGIPPSERVVTAMQEYNDALVKAGVVLAGEGLQPSTKGKRLLFTDGTKSVIDGPFPETSELISGFWLWQVRSMDEAIEWARRCPGPMLGEPAVVEIRPVIEADALGDTRTLGRRDQEPRLPPELDRAKKP